MGKIVNPSNACKDVPSILEGNVSQTSQYEDLKIKHKELI